MKTLLMILSLTALIFSGCKKDEETDSRDQFIGTFNGTQSVNVPSLDWVQTFTGNATISKSSEEGKIIIIDETTMTAKVSGNQYVYDKFTETETVDGETVTVEVTGSGIITNGIITETGTVTYFLYGGEYSGTWTRTMTRI